LLEKETTPRGPKQDHQADFPLISEYKNLKNYLVVGRENRSILQDSGRVLHKRSEVKTDTFVNSVLFRFTKGLFRDIPFSDKLLDYLHEVSAVWCSGA